MKIQKTIIYREPLTQSALNTNRTHTGSSFIICLVLVFRLDMIYK